MTEVTFYKEGRLALEAGTYTIKAWSGNVFRPFDVVIKEGEMTIVDK